ncbi:retrovirus-related pol polyprotein from transposon TNT 1-94, partial [Tanacetum coccineum]
MTGDRSQLTNFVHKFLGTVKFGNDQIAKIMRYGDYQIGNITILRVYYVEGLGHNLFFIGQFCDSDLKVAFRKHTYFVRNLEGVDLLSGSRETNLYTLSIGDMMASSPICKRKKQSHKPKSEGTNHEKLYLLHMDLYGPMRVASINGKKYILIIVDDYSLFTWVKFLALIIKFLKMIQVRLNMPARNIRTDNGTEFVNQTLHRYYESVGISHETSVSLSPQQNGVIERQNRTLLTAMASEQLGSGPGLQSMTPATSNSGLVTNPIPQQPCIPPPRDDWDCLFQPMIDEYFNPPTITVSPVLVANAPRAVDLAYSPVSMSIDQDAPSTSIPSTQDQEHSPIISQGFEELPKTPHFHDDPLLESLYE